MIVPLADQKYLSFRHKTNEVQLRASDGDVIRETLISEPLSSLACYGADAWNNFILFGADGSFQIYDVESGEPQGSISLPFVQIGGVVESRKHQKLLFWGDDQYFVLYDLSRDLSKE